MAPDDDVVGVIVIGGVVGFGLVKRRRDELNTSGDDLDRDFISLKSIINSSTFKKKKRKGNDNKGMKIRKKGS